MFHKYKPFFISIGLILLVSILLYRLIVTVFFPNFQIQRNLFTKPLSKEGLIPYENGWQFISPSTQTSLIIPTDWGYREGQSQEEFSKLGQITQNIQFGSQTKPDALFQYLSLTPINQDIFNTISQCLVLSGDCSHQMYSGKTYVKLTQSSLSGAYITQHQDQLKIFIYANLEQETLVNIMESIKI